MQNLPETLRREAKRLAVSYKAFCDAIDENDALGICVWGDVLISAQNRLDVELVTIDQIRRNINDARAERTVLKIVA